MKKLAFCFLTYDNLNKSDIWKHFFNNIDSKLYNIYFNSKHDTTDDFKQYQIKNRYTNTKWGDISLVKATLKLFEEAFNQDENNEYFILLSNSCIPINNFNNLYNYLIETNQSHIYGIPRNDIINRFDDLKDQTFFNKKDWKYQYQWMVLKRELVEFFIKNDYCDIFGDNIFCPDEHYFINLCIKFNLPFNNKSLTFVNWDDYSDNPEYRKYPKTYDEVDINKMLELKKDYFFMRKISHRFNFPIEFINHVTADFNNIILSWCNKECDLFINSDRKEDKLSIDGTIFLLEELSIKYNIIKKEDINTLQNKNIIIFGHYNCSNFTKNILTLQDNNKILLLPHTNLNYISMRKFNQNITIIAREYKTFNLYKKYCPELEKYIFPDMSFYNSNNNININIDINSKEEIVTTSFEKIMLCKFNNKKCIIKDKENSINKYLYDYILKYFTIFHIIN